jgi:hypothetical protein
MSAPSLALERQVGVRGHAGRAGHHLDRPGWTGGLQVALTRPGRPPGPRQLRRQRLEQLQSPRSCRRRWSSADRSSPWLRRAPGGPVSRSAGGREITRRGTRMARTSTAGRSRTRSQRRDWAAAEPPPQDRGRTRATPSGRSDAPPAASAAPCPGGTAPAPPGSFGGSARLASVPAGARPTVGRPPPSSRAAMSPVVEADDCAWGSDWPGWRRTARPAARGITGAPDDAAPDSRSMDSSWRPG